METGKISYVEFPATDLDKARQFYTASFGWRFTDYGDDYTAFSDSGLEGGFFRADLSSSSALRAALVVLYSADLEKTQGIIETNGGVISQPIFSFPGGRRFHFLDPNGNELAVWSDNEPA